MNIIIDIGNTRIKTAIFNFDQIVELNIHKNEADFIESLTNLKIQCDNCIVAATGLYSDKLKKQLHILFKKVIELNGFTKLPFNNLYQTKETQGPDRIAAIAGAQLKFQNENILIIDAGTAITFDFIDKNGNYLGGNISPGIEMRFKALHTFTQKLPLLNISEQNLLLGLSTTDAITYGVQNSMIFEIEQYIQTLSQNYENLRTIMTGGDADFLANKLKNTIFVDSNLVLKGLNRILEYNVNN
jgi:type III pantothenate kinase